MDLTRVQKEGRRRGSSSVSSLEKIRLLHAKGSRDMMCSESVQDACKCFDLSDDQLKEIMRRMEESFEEGLRTDVSGKAAVKMLPSYVRSVPNGSEIGCFLALDLGGTNFRVLLITLKKNSESEMKSKIFRVPENIMRGTGLMLFDHIASCLAKFMEDNNIKEKEKLPLGFTFSFPCSQDGLTSARLTNWTKGFNATGVVGEDVVELLREACQRRGDIDIDVVAVLNDTTGTLMSCAYLEPTCNIGVICGTGSNACYMERIDRIPKITRKVSPDEDGLPSEMCVNTEWGAFGDDGKIDQFRTKYDVVLDSASINPGKQLFEKMISGMYLGEVVRLVLLDLARQGKIFGGDWELINTPGCFPTKYLSEIEKEFEEEDGFQFPKTEQMLQELGVWATTINECANIAYICSSVSKRAAYLCACGIAALLKRMQKEYVTVGVDGSVYRFHPTFKENLDHKIDDLLEGKFEFQLMLSEDGSGRGAALVAAVATRMAKEASDLKLTKFAGPCASSSLPSTS